MLLRCAFVLFIHFFNFFNYEKQKNAPIFGSLLRFAWHILPSKNKYYPPPQNKILSSCMLPAPSTFTGTRTSGTTADLSWSSVAGASAYRLYVWEVSGSTTILISNTVETGTSKTLTNLESGKDYRCGLSSICSDGVTSDYVIIIDIIS